MPFALAASAAASRHDEGMRMTYDPEADAAYFSIVEPIGPGEARESHIVNISMD